MSLRVDYPVKRRLTPRPPYDPGDCEAEGQAFSQAMPSRSRSLLVLSS